MTSLVDLAHAAGLEPQYRGWRGDPVDASADAVVAMLRALGHEVPGAGDAGDVGEAMAAIERARWDEIAPPVAVAWDGGRVALPLRADAELDAGWQLELTCERGAIARAAGRLHEAAAAKHAWPASLGGRVHCERIIAIDIPGGELGYHRLRWQIGDRAGDTLVIAAPTRAWGAPGDAPPRWGVFAPLYAMRDARSGAAGDLHLLRALFERVRERGGHYVATLPLLAAFLDEPCHPSPYAPASRLFWNELYCGFDVDWIAREPDVTRTPEVVARAAALAAAPLVDYRAQYAWRRAILDNESERAWSVPLDRSTMEGLAARRGLADYAVFRAIGEQERRPWPEWPARWRDELPYVASMDEVPDGVDLARVRSHVHAQWRTAGQLGELKADFDGLYLDLPVGVNRDAYEVWRYRDQFLFDLSAGAPPDALFLGGQDWGLPPLSPRALRATGYRYFIDCIRHHMDRASMLRIDHVMGLHRLYCVPRGFAATDGVYLRYRADELYAILTLESHRNQCALAGEDLGTVPDEVRPMMRRHGIASLFVGQFEMPARLGDAMGTPTGDHVASLNTHDTATFAGYWQGADITDKLDLHLIDAPAADAERAARAITRDALLASLDIAPSDVGAPTADNPTACAAAASACTRALAASPAHVVLINLEDLWLEPAPQNVPGTCDERPNWRRPWSRTLTDLFADPASLASIDDVARLRHRG